MQSWHDKSYCLPSKISGPSVANCPRNGSSNLDSLGGSFYLLFASAIAFVGADVLCVPVLTIDPRWS